MLVFLDQVHDGHALDRRVFAESDVDHAGRRIDLDHAIRLGQHTQAVHVDQRLALRRQLAEAVHDFFQQAVDLVGGLGGGQFFVKAQAQMHIAAVVVGQQRRRVQIDLGGHAQRAEQIGLDAGFKATHGFRQHLVVELKADFQHIARLVLAQHLAGTPNLQVVHG